MSDIYYHDRENLRLVLENILECFATQNLETGWATLDRDENWFSVNEDLENALCRAEEVLNRLDNDEEELEDEVDPPWEDKD
jgi:hypothetical protein